MIIKLIIIAFGLGLVAAVPASAANPNLYIAGVKQTKEPTTPTKFTGSNNSAFLFGKDVELPIISCPETEPEIEVSGRLETPKEGAVSLTEWGSAFKYCRVVNNANSEQACDAEFTVRAESNGVLTKPEEVTVKKSVALAQLGTVLVLNERGFKCEYAGFGTVTGEQACKLPKMATEEWDHKIECLGGESKNLRFTFTIKNTVSAGAELWLTNKFIELTIQPLTKWSIR